MPPGGGEKMMLGFPNNKGRSMKKIHFIGVIGNSLLFLSSFLLLINFAPHDLFPSYIKMVKAIQKLKKAQNILVNIPENIKIKSGSESLNISSDPDTFAIIAKFIKDRSPLSSNVNWQEAVGVGYSKITVPVFKTKLEAFHPLYIVTLPIDNSDILNLEAVGQLSDLETWLKVSRLNFLNKTAIVLLSLGFFLQLIEKILEIRSKVKRPDPVVSL
jgi:hypothetical protein